MMQKDRKAFNFVRILHLFYTSLKALICIYFTPSIDKPLYNKEGDKTGVPQENLRQQDQETHNSICGQYPNCY